MKILKPLFCIVCIIAVALCPLLSPAGSVMSGVRDGLSGVAAMPTIITTLVSTNFTLGAGNAIDMGFNRLLVLDMSYNGSAAATNGSVCVFFAPSLDGTTYDPTRTFSITKAGFGTTNAIASTNYDAGAYNYVIPLSVSNGLAVTISNLTVRYETKPGN